MLPRRVRRRCQQQRRRATERQAPHRHAGVDQPRRRRHQRQHQGSHGKHREADQGQPAQPAIHQQADDPDPDQRTQAEHQQHPINPLSQPDLHQERCNVGVENVVSEHPGQHHQQHRPHARQAQRLQQRQAFGAVLARTVRHRDDDPRRQHQGQRRHDPERRTPTDQVAQPGSRRRAQRQRHWRAEHGNRQRPPLLMHRHDAAGVTGHDPPRQPRRHPGEEARGQGQAVMAGERSNGVEHQEAADRHQQHPPPWPAPGGDGQRNRRDNRAQRIQRHQLPGEHFADPEPGADLRQQSGWQGFGEDGNETGHGERQQRGIRQFFTAGGAVDAGEVGACGVGHDRCSSLLS